MKVVLTNGSVVDISSNHHTDEQMKNIMLTRQEIATNYCKQKGWPVNPLELTFEQIILA